MHVCDMEGEEGLRWTRIIKAVKDVSMPHLLLWVAMAPPSRWSFKCQPPPCPVYQFRVPSPMMYSYSNNSHNDWIGDCISLPLSPASPCRRCSTCANTATRYDIGEAWHFPTFYIFHQIRKSFTGIKWKHRAHVLLDSYPRSSVSGAHFHWLDGILRWHSESQYLL